MRAVYIREFGAPEVVEVGALPEPLPGPGEVCISVKSAALNHLDIWVRRGRPGASLEQPLILGSDAAGIVHTVGLGVSQFKPGDEVIVNPGVGSLHDEFGLRGRQNQSPEFKLLGFHLPGTYAERLIVPAVNIQPKPAHLNWHEAAALSLAHLTAWHMLFSRAALQPGESVLIHGIGGGVALAALQLSRMNGCETIVTSSCEKKLERARALGADHTIDYRTEDVPARVRVLTGGRGVDLSVDTVGAPTIPLGLASLRRGGRLVNCGITGGAEAKINVQMLYWNHLTLIGSTMGTLEDFRSMTRAICFSRLKPVVDAVFPLERYVQAVTRMEQGAQFGKLVLSIS